MPQRVTLAVAQSHTRSSPTDTLAGLEQTVHRAAARNAGLLLFPEAYLGGYPRGSTFGSGVGTATATGRAQYLSYHRNAVDLGDTPAGAGDAWVARRLSVAPDAEYRGDGTREALERIAHATGVFLVVGAVEKAGGSLYCACVYVCPERGCVGKRRKVMPTGAERVAWAQGSPATLKAVTAVIRGVRVTLAAAICWENYMPLLRQSVSAQGVNLYLAPAADGQETWLPLMRTVALEGRTFVVSAIQCLRKKNLPHWSRASEGSPQIWNNDGKASEDVQAGDGPVDDMNGDLDGRDESGRETSRDGEADSRSMPAKPSRRRSTVTRTPENHEITWPAKSEPSGSEEAIDSPKSPIIVREGTHELCLPCGRRRKSTAERSAGSQDQGLLPPEDGQADKLDPVLESPRDSDDEFACRGGSCIVDPAGNVVAGPLWEDEDGLLVASVDFDDCIRQRLEFDCVGHYSRSDAFRLTVEGLDLIPPP